MNPQIIKPIAIAALKLALEAGTAYLLNKAAETIPGRTGKTAKAIILVASLARPFIVRS